MSIWYILLAILLLGILIAVHEAGHFLFSRLVGIEVREFSIGMGPAVWTRNGKSGTKFSLRLIPVGGYCAFYGEDDVTGREQDDPRAYARQPVWKRMISVLMGPCMNFILAFVVAAGFYAIAGVEYLQGYQPYISDVAGTGPAYDAGLKPGDVITRLDGEALLLQDLSEFTAKISAWTKDRPPLELTVERGGETHTLTLTPFWDEAEQRYRMGVIISGLPVTETRKVSLGTAAHQAWDWCVYAGGVILGALRDLVTTGEGLDQTSGPVGVVSMVSQQVQQYGARAFINLLIVISINLGIMNLLPIPGLDGSRFLFLLLEAVRRRPIAPEKEARVHLAGYLLLFGLMILITFRDVMRLFR